MTGAGSRGEGIGNGRAIAVLMAQAGARVVAADRDASALDATLAMIAETGVPGLGVVADVGDPAGCAQIVNGALERFGQLDVLVNNVGIVGPAGTAEDVDPEAWDEAFRINVKSVMLMARHAVPALRRSSAAAIVNVSSIVAQRGGHPSLCYPATKSAVLGMTTAMASHYGPAGIRVNSVMPGNVFTPMVTARGMSEEMRLQRRENNLLKIEGTGWDVGYATLFLASQAARWITGVILPVDGGLTSSVPLPTLPVSRG